MGAGFISYAEQKAHWTIRQTELCLYGPQRDFVFWVEVRDEWEDVWGRWRWRGAGTWGRRPKMRIFDNRHINRHLSDGQRLDMQHQQPASGSWVCAGQSRGRRRSDEMNSLGKLSAQHCPHMVEQRMTRWGDLGFPVFFKATNLSLSLILFKMIMVTWVWLCSKFLLYITHKASPLQTRASLATLL